MRAMPDTEPSRDTKGDYGDSHESEASRYVRQHLDRVRPPQPAMFTSMVDRVLSERQLGWREVGQQSMRAERAEARVREVEALLREVVEEPAVRDPLGTLPPDSEWVRGARDEQGRQRRRARAVLEGGSDD